MIKSKWLRLLDEVTSTHTEILNLSKERIDEFEEIIKLHSSEIKGLMDELEELKKTQELYQTDMELIPRPKKWSWLGGWQ